MELISDFGKTHITFKEGDNRQFLNGKEKLISILGRN